MAENIFTKIAWNYDFYVTKLYFSVSVWQHIQSQDWFIVLWNLLEIPCTVRKPRAPFYWCPFLTSLTLPLGDGHFSLWTPWLFSTACYFVYLYLPELQDCGCGIFSNSLWQQPECAFSYLTQPELRGLPDLWLVSLSSIQREFFPLNGIPYRYYLCFYYLLVTCVCLTARVFLFWFPACCFVSARAFSFCPNGSFFVFCLLSFTLFLGIFLY